MVLGLRQFTERSAAGAGEPVLDVNNGEELMHVQPNTTIVLDNRPPESPGTLYITSEKVVWLSDVDSEKGYAVDFLSVSLHAVCTDAESYPLPCIYAQIETEADEDESQGSDSECDEPRDLSMVTEMRIVPSDPLLLTVLFDVFCECAEMNPGPIEGEEEEEHNWIFSADQIEGQEIEEPEWIMPHESANSIGHSNGNHDLASEVLQLHINDQRFEDAEEMEHDRSNGHN